jgi:IS30 family transposase
MPPLTETQRYQIEHDLRLGLTNQQIATGAGCSRRTIERELARCGGRAHYQAARAQADRRRCALTSAANHPMLPAARCPMVGHRGGSLTQALA